MKAFMDKDFLLETETAKHLYHDYASKMPLADYHCHLNPREIFEDRRFDNLGQVWLGGLENGVLAGDHYPYGLTDSQWKGLIGHKIGFGGMERHVSDLVIWNTDPLKAISVNNAAVTVVDGKIVYRA